MVHILILAALILLVLHAKDLIELLYSFVVNHSEPMPEWMIELDDELRANGK